MVKIKNRRKDTIAKMILHLYRFIYIYIDLYRFTMSNVLYLYYFYNV